MMVTLAEEEKVGSLQVANFRFDLRLQTADMM